MSYDRLTKQAARSRKKNNWKQANRLMKEAQSMPSSDPIDQNFRRLWYVRYADDFLLGLIGCKEEALEIKEKISSFLHNNLKLELNAEKTLITHARDQRAKFLGYEVHVLHEDSKRGRNSRRCINGGIGLRIPDPVRKEKCAQYMRYGKPVHLSQRTIDDAYSTVSRYQAEYRGIVQYYRMAYNLHTLSALRYVMEVSLVKTLASKYKTTRTRIYKRYRAEIETDDKKFKVILVKIEREPPKEPLITYFGGISLKWNRRASINEGLTRPIYGRHSELVQRLLAQECELCESRDKVELSVFLGWTLPHQLLR